MPRIPSIKPVRDKGRAKPWRIDIPASISEHGKRERFYFETKAEAETYAEVQRTKLKNFGVKGATILSPSTQDQAANAVELLKPYGVTLNEVVKDWIARKQASEASVTFEDAFEAFQSTGRRSQSYTRSLRQTKNRLAPLHGRKLNIVTPAMIEGAIASMKPSVRNFTLRILGGLFMLGIKRGWCSDNPVKRVDMAHREATEIKVYSPKEVATIMETVAEHAPELIPTYALLFFTGIRLAEVQRLEWSAVDQKEKFLKLPAAITKTKRTRHVDLSKNALAWLAPHVKACGKVVPLTPDVLHKRMHAIADIHGVPVIKHGPRHAFASYWLAEHGDVDRLCLALGHESPDMTFRHYAKAATKREAKQFWKITPKRIQGGKIIEFRKEAA